MRLHAIRIKEKYWTALNWSFPDWINGVRDLHGLTTGYTLTSLQRGGVRLSGFTRQENNG